MALTIGELICGSDIQICFSLRSTRFMNNAGVQKMILQNRSAFFILALLALTSSHIDRDKKGLPLISSQAKLQRLMKNQCDYIVSCFMDGHLDHADMQEEGQSTSAGNKHSEDVFIARDYYLNQARNFRQRWQTLNPEEQQKLELAVLKQNSLSEFEKQLLSTLSQRKASQERMSLSHYYSSLKTKFHQWWHHGPTMSFLGHSIQPSYIILQIQLFQSHRRRAEIQERIQSVSKQTPWYDWSRQFQEIMRQCEQLLKYASEEGITIALRDCSQIHQILMKLQMVQSDAIHFKQVYCALKAYDLKLLTSHQFPQEIDQMFRSFPEETELPIAPRFEKHSLYNQGYWDFKMKYLHYLMTLIRHFWAVHFSLNLSIVYGKVPEKQILEVALYRGLTQTKYVKQNSQYLCHSNQWSALINVIRSFVFQARQKNLSSAQLYNLQQLQRFLILIGQTYEYFATKWLKRRQVQLFNLGEQLYQHAKKIRLVYRAAKTKKGYFYPFVHEIQPHEKQPHDEKKLHRQMEDLKKQLQNIGRQIFLKQSEINEAQRSHVTSSKLHTPQVFGFESMDTFSRKKPSASSPSSSIVGSGPPEKKLRRSSSPSSSLKSQKKADSDQQEEFPNHTILAVQEAELGVLGMSLPEGEQRSLREGTALSLGLSLSQYLSILRRATKHV